MLHRNQTAQRYRRPSFLEVLTVSKSHAFVSAIAYVQGEYIEFIKMKNQRHDGKRAGHYQRQHNSKVWLEFFDGIETFRNTLFVRNVSSLT